MKNGLPIAAAAIAAPLAGTLWWMLVDQIGMGQAFRSPVPYLLLMVSWFVATPVYLAAHGWIAGKLWRLILLATVGAAPFVLAAIAYLLTPRDIFASFLILSTTWASAITFWGVMRVTSTEDTARD
jgi:hypothetical protein